MNGALLSQILRKRIRLQGTTLRARTTEVRLETLKFHGLLTGSASQFLW